MQPLFRHLCRSFGLILVAVWLAACGRLAPPGSNQPLVVGMLADPVFYDPAPENEHLPGFGREAIERFAARLSSQVRIITVADPNALAALLERGKVHLTARLVPHSETAAPLRTPPLLLTPALIVGHADGKNPTHRSDLAGREIAALARAPQIDTLLTLGLSPPPHLVTPAAAHELELLAEVARGRQPLAASDALHLAVAARRHPELVAALELPTQLAYVWEFRDPALAAAGQAFIAENAASGWLRRLEERYFSHIRRAEVADMREFLDQTRRRLPALRPHFQLAQEITGIDWRLLAALAYQESHWDPLATSPTGVRGIMMLTEETADRLGVKNRLDAQESILAGAKYLAQLRDELPATIRGADRLWFALAAYNLGRGHLNGARAFAPGLKRDPDSWNDMKEVLPLMSRPEYYVRLKSGRARGGEAVIMVENVRNYYDVLTRIEPRYTPPTLEKPKPIAKKKKRPQRGRNTSSPPR